MLGTAPFFTAIFALSKTYVRYPVIMFLAVALKVAALDVINKSDQASNHLEMSISLSNGVTNVPVNQPVVLRITFKNTSTNEIFSIYNSVREEEGEGYSFAITTPSGTNETVLTGPLHGSAAMITVGPGETREREFNLSRLYGFHETGVYRVVAKYKNLNGAPYFEAVSNPLEVNVIKVAEKSETPKTNNPIERWSP